MIDLNERTVERKEKLERMFAGAVFIAPEYARESCGWLKPDLLSNMAIRAYWASVLSGSEPIAAALEARTLTDVTEWAEGVPNAHSSPAFAREIVQTQYLADQGNALKLVARAISDSDAKRCAEVVADMAAMRPLTGIRYRDAYDVALDFVVHLKAGDHAIPTYIVPLDAAIGGSERGSLNLVAARPSMGKSAFVNQLGQNAARAGHKVAMFPLETGATSLAKRWACGAACVSWRDVMRGQAPHDVLEKVAKAATDIALQFGKNMAIFDGHHSTDSVWEAVAQFKPDLVIIDHLEYLEDTSGESKVDCLGIMAQRLKSMAIDLNCCVWLVHQLNRGVESRDNKRPVLADLRESGYLEQIADLVIMLYRKDYYKQEEGMMPPRVSATELLIQKYRDGASLRRVNVSYDTLRQWFEDPKTPNGNGNGHEDYTEH